LYLVFETKNREAKLLFPKDNGLLNPVEELLPEPILSTDT